MDILSLTE